MNFDDTKTRYRAICVAFAAALALSLAACGDKPAADTAAKIESAAESAARQAKQAVAGEEKMKAETAKNAAAAKGDADQALATKVKAAIVGTPGLETLPMDVRASDGAVTLFGTADDEAQRRQAGKAAAGVRGVKSVKNQLLIVRGS